MTVSNGHHGTSYATDDAPAARDWGDETVMDETVRVGLVGLGRMGRVHAANLAGRTPGARLVRMVDADEDPDRVAPTRSPPPSSPGPPSVPSVS